MSLSTPNPDRGQRVHEERVRLGYTLNQIAHVCCASLERWKSYEQGEEKLDELHLAVFGAIGADTRYVITGRRYASNQDHCNSHLFAVRLKSECERLGLSTWELDQLTGRGNKALNWLSGTVSPRATDLMSMGEAGLDTHYLLTGKRLVPLSKPTKSTQTAQSA